MATLGWMTPVLLAFDTSTEALAVALQWAGGRLAWNGEGGAQASVALLPTVQRLLDERLQRFDLLGPEPLRILDGLRRGGRG